MGAWSTEMFPGVPSEPQAPGQGPGAERDVCELFVQTCGDGGADGTHRPAGPSRAGHSSHPSSPAPRGPAGPAGALLGSWPPGPCGWWAFPAPGPGVTFSCLDHLATGP